MEHRIGQAVVCLHVVAALCLIAGVAGLARLSFGPPQDFEVPHPAVAWFMAGSYVLYGAGVEITAWGLNKRKRWAWVVALVIFVWYLTTLLIPLGVIGLIGLLSEGSRREFGIVTSSERG